MKTYPSVYCSDWETAQMQGKTENYLQSFHENILCKEAIESVLAQNFDGMRLKAGVENLLIEKFGIFRVTYVVAATIQQSMFDERFSRANKNWAQMIPVASDINLCQLKLSTHPVVLNGFTDMIQILFREQNKSENKSFDTIRLIQGRIQYDDPNTSYPIQCILYEKDAVQYIKPKAVLDDILESKCKYTIKTKVIKGIPYIPVSLQKNNNGTFQLQIMSDCLLPQKENAGYKILLEANQPEHTVVLGQSTTDVSGYVTWREKNEDTYFWGRYFSNKQSVNTNFTKRVKEGSDVKRSQEQLFL